MGSVPVNNNGGGTGDRGLAELNYHRRYEHKEVRDGVVGEGQDLSEEDESRINAVVQDVNEGRERSAFQAQPSLPQLQPQGSVVQWERFLPLRTLKVLLVETDDSTRHVVSALLRNCSYEVTAVSNGMQAWKILQDLTNCIDIVLTEVIMPALSGIGLLCKIMNHKTCKNIPVIMMSSHDSMGIVFKCLSKGAVDFLVKPIRKNELKNLWQHVWRRCHSSSGSGSESGIQQKFAKSKSVEESDNNTGSNDMDDNVKDGSDIGSGTQSSWTKRAVEVDSPQPTVQWDQLVNHTDSTCAQVIHPKSETFGNERMAVDAKKECPERDEKLLDNIAMSKDLEIGVPRSKQHEDGSEKVCTNMPELRESEQLDKGLQEHNSNKPTIELRAQFTNFAGLTTNCFDPQADAVASEAPNGFCKPSEIEDKTSDDPKEPVSLELSLKTMRGVVADVGTTTPDEHNILRHSDMSAFSRYNTASTANQAPTGIVGSCSPHDNSSEAMKTESMHNQQSNESSDNNDMGSTTKKLFAKPAAINEKSTSMSTARYVHSSAFRPVQSGRICSPVQIMPQKVDDVAGNASGAQPRDAHKQVQVQHHHHHYHHHHHHVHGMQQQQQQTPDQDDLSLNITTSTMQCVSSDVFGGPIEGNGGNYSLNGSASGSNNGINRQNGSGKDVNVGGTNSENDVGVTRKNIVGASGSGSSTGSGVDQNQFSQRVAALTKFRQKRKERCFEKKVRYQSRKMLAEQRPRVRGQFVRQRLYENNDREANS